MTAPSPEPPAALLHRITDTHQAQETAAAVHDQAIRDAAAAGHPLTAIARTLGVTNRKRIYAVLANPPTTDPTAPTPVVYLRGAGASPATWNAIQTALHARGLTITRDRQQAWHLARGHIPVILLDFSAGKIGTAGPVRARWKTTSTTGPVSRLLARPERQRLTADHAPWLDTPVTTENQTPDLPLADPETAAHFPTDTIDPDQLARIIIEQLPPGPPNQEP